MRLLDRIAQTEVETGVAETHAVRRGGEELLQLSVQRAVLVPGNDGVHVLQVR